MKVEVVFFEGCPNHPSAVELVRSVIQELDLGAEVEEIEVTNQDEAERHRLLGSPTIHVNGIDIDPSARERTDYAFSCRLYDGENGLPSRAMVVDALSTL